MPFLATQTNKTLIYIKLAIKVDVNTYSRFALITMDFILQHRIKPICRYSFDSRCKSIVTSNFKSGLKFKFNVLSYIVQRSIISYVTFLHSRFEKLHILLSELEHHARTTAETMLPAPSGEVKPGKTKGTGSTWMA